MKTFDVTICLKVTLTVRCEASSEPDAEDLAHEAAGEAIERMREGSPRKGYSVIPKEDDRSVHLIREVRE